MILRTIIFLLLFASFSFAAWQEVAGLAIFTSLMLVILVYMIGFGFGVDILKVTAKDEIYQLMALAFMVVIFFGANNMVDAISTAPELTGEQANMQTTALVSLNSSIENLSRAYNSVAYIDKSVGFAASEGLSCNYAGMGYFVSGCGGFSMLAGPFSLVGSIMGFALGEMNAVYRLIDIALNYSLTLLLPLGIILRTFRITRGAGGFLIAIGIAMHILLPVGILFVDLLGDSFLAGPTSGEYSESPQLSDLDIDCEQGNTGEANPENAINVYRGLRHDMKSFIYLILVKATLGPIISVLMMIGGIRYLSALAGAEVDVSALARVI